ncbi:MAG: insulinase family protein [Spirochaetaceae bacterium]|nr:insulinase family protein [Spirochaetaceae bacterium]
MPKIKCKYLAITPVILILTFFCLTCATGSAVYNGLDSNEKIPVTENLRQGILANGMRYYIYENGKPENRAYLTLAVNAGAVLENEDELGLAHFVEHMAFNGTARFSESEVVDYLRSLGMRFGAEINAFTSADETVYSIEVPVETDESGTRRIPEKALDIIADWSSAITFAPEDVDDERSVIMEEYRLRRFGAAGRRQKILLTGLLEGSRYAERDVIGLPEVIEYAPAERLKSFYKKWYKPENMAVIFAGDFDGQALEESLAASFDMPASDASFVRPEYFLPQPEKNNVKVEVFADTEIPYTQAVLFYKQRYVESKNTVAEYRNGLIENLISNMLDERFEDVRLDPQSPYVAVGAYYFSLVRSSRFYTLSFASKPGMIARALDDLLAVKESVRRYGFSDAEIERAKEAVLSGIEQLAAEKEKSESYYFISKMTNHYLNNAPVPDIVWELEATEKLLPSISKKDIHNAVKGYFSHNDVFVFISAAEAETQYIPPEDVIAQKIKTSAGIKVKRPDKTAFNSELLDGMPKRGSVLEETVHEDAGVIEWKLDNGACILLKNTANQNDNIELYAVSRGGTAAAPLEDAVSAKFAAELLSLSGAGRWTRSDIYKKLSGKQVSFSFNANNFTRSVQGSSNAAGLKTFFELLYLYFTAFKIDSDAVSVLLDEYRTVLAMRSLNPEGAFSDEVQKITSGGNPRFMPLTVDDLSKFDAYKAHAFLEKCFNPADYTFVFTGNIDLKTMSDMAETYIASIPKKESFNQWVAPVPPLQRPGKTEAVVRQGKEDKSYVYSGRFIAKTFDEKTAMACSLLSEYLDIILMESIREKLGGTYSISASSSLLPIPPDGELVFETTFACDPKRVEELNGAVEAELANIASGNIDADTFGKAQKALVKDWEQSVQSNGFLSRTFANYSAVFDIPLGRLYSRPAGYESLRPADIQNLMKQILDNGPATVILYPAEINENMTQ